MALLLWGTTWSTASDVDNKNVQYAQSRQGQRETPGIVQLFTSPMNYISSMVSSTFGFSENEDSAEAPRRRRPTIVRFPRETGPAFFHPNRPMSGPFPPFFESGRFPPPHIGGRSANEGKGFWTGSLKSHFKMIESQDDGQNPIIHQEELKEDDNFVNILQQKEREEKELLSQQEALHQKQEFQQHAVRELNFVTHSPLPSANHFSFPLEPINTGFEPSQIRSLQSSVHPQQFTVSNAIPSQFINAEEANALKQWQEWGRLVGRNPNDDRRKHFEPHVSHSFSGNSVFRREVPQLTRGNSFFTSGPTNVIHGNSVFKREVPHAPKPNAIIKEEVHRKLHKVNDVVDALQIVVDALQHTQDGERIYLSRGGPPISAATLMAASGSLSSGNSNLRKPTVSELDSGNRRHLRFSYFDLARGT